MKPSPNIKIQFGNAIRNARTGQGLSQEELADLCGLDRSYLGGVERGQRNLGIVAIGRIAAALKISLSELFSSVNTDC